MLAGHLEFVLFFKNFHFSKSQKYFLYKKNQILEFENKKNNKFGTSFESLGARRELVGEKER